MIYRIAAIAFGLACAMLVLMIVVSKSNAADFNSDWLLEDLTCSELISGYTFELEVLKDLVSLYDECLDFYTGTNATPHGDLHCALLKKEGEFVLGLTNDIAAVFNAKPECTGAKP